MKKILLGLAFLIVGIDFCSGMEDKQTGEHSKKSVNQKKEEKKTRPSCLKSGKAKVETGKKDVKPVRFINFGHDFDIIDGVFHLKDLEKLKEKLVKNRELKRTDREIFISGIKIDFEVITEAILFVNFEISRLSRCDSEEVDLDGITFNGK